MECKNCHTLLNESDAHCSQCGAKVVRERLTLKYIWSNFAEQFFGWDNKYLRTTWNLIAKPEEVLSNFIGGTRKKYIAPIAYLAIALAVAMLIFNFFADEYISASNTMSGASIDALSSILGDSDSNQLGTTEERNAEMYELQVMGLRYLNFVVLINLPFYAFITFIVYGKPHNYSEHLVINFYLQGLGLLMTSVFFLISLVSTPVVYTSSILVLVLYYIYAFKRLNEYNWSKTIIKFFKFLLVMLLSIVLLFVVTIGLGIVVGYFLG